MTFKKKTMEFLNKMLCGFVTLYRDKVVPLRFQVVGVYTNDLSKSSQRARSFFFFFFFFFFFDLPCTLPMMNMLLSANQRCSFYGFFQRLVILGADQKDRSLCERDWEQSVTGSNGLSSSVISVFQRTTVKNSFSKSIAQQARFTVEIETENSLS